MHNTSKLEDKGLQYDQEQSSWTRVKKVDKTYISSCIILLVRTRTRAKHVDQATPHPQKLWGSSRSCVKLEQILWTVIKQLDDNHVRVINHEQRQGDQRTGENHENNIKSCGQ
jgi:hypothetical protein